MMFKKIDEKQIKALLASANLNGAFKIYPLKGGANNQLFCVMVAGQKTLLKVYFRHATDPRDRLNTEFNFLNFAWETGVRSIPQPLAIDQINGLALYTFIEGRKLKAREIGKEEIDQASSFFRALNQHKDGPLAKALPFASEACFSIAEHIQLVDERLKRLQGVKASSCVGREAKAFVYQDLIEVWGTVRESVIAQAKQNKFTIEKEISSKDRYLSPSDFGFHNALLTPRDKLVFIDFEYAGWDDPAKTVCDFFCQPAVPVPAQYFDYFTQKIITDLTQVKLQKRRAKLLLPIYKIKWCCILLNEFLPLGLKRRDFAAKMANQEERKRQQLTKARALLSSVLKPVKEGK